MVPGGWRWLHLGQERWIGGGIYIPTGPPGPQSVLAHRDEFADAFAVGRYLKSLECIWVGLFMISTRHRVQARQAITRWHRTLRPLRPRCGAKRKYDGQPCQQIAMANGRCSYHGGRTPKRDGWHKPRWPNGDVPDAERKLARKLGDLEKLAAKRLAKLAAMSPGERARYEEWRQSHRPGSGASRAAARRAQVQVAETAALLAAPPAVDPAAEAVARAIEELEHSAEAIALRMYE